MTDENTPADGYVLRQAPPLNTALEGEATPLVSEQPLAELEEMTPVIDSGPAYDQASEITDPMIDQHRIELTDEAIRLPRTGLDELDFALGDLESALTHLGAQDRRLIFVLACCFISLFMPWFRVWNHGPSLPTTPVSGLELAGLTCLFMIVSLVVFILAQRMSDELLRGNRRLVIRLFTAALMMRMLIALTGAPVDQIPWRHSAWAIVPFVLSLALLAGLMQRLPAFPRRPLPPS